MKDEILPLFRNVLLVCQEMDLLEGLSLPGWLKLPSNASTKWSGTYSELHRKKARLEAKVEQLLRRASNKRIKETWTAWEPKVQTRQPGEAGAAPTKAAKRLEKWLQENQAKYGTTKKEISSNITDNDSAKMRTSHGRRPGLQQPGSDRW